MDGSAIRLLRPYACNSPAGRLALLHLPAAYSHTYICTNCDIQGEARNRRVRDGKVHDIHWPLCIYVLPGRRKGLLVDAIQARRGENLCGWAPSTRKCFDSVCLGPASNATMEWREPNLGLGFSDDLKFCTGMTGEGAMCQVAGRRNQNAVTRPACGRCVGVLCVVGLLWGGDTWGG